MYENKCKANCLMNPKLEKRKECLSIKFKGKEISERIVIKKNCPKCDCIFEIKATESEIRRNKVKKYCSIKCGNSRKVSDETKKKISFSLINNGKRYRPNNKNRKYNRKKNITIFKCVGCSKEGIDNKGNKNRKYHSECWKEFAGGIRQGSSRGKSGWYKGYWCDSSYELAYLIYNIDKKEKIERNKNGFKYIFNNKEHLFYPDFIVNDNYVEIKNYKSDLTNAKLEYFPFKITIYYKEEMDTYIEYAIKNYGKDFINLYE